MAKSQFGKFSNIVLSRLTSAARERLQPHLQSVELPIKKFISQPNQPIKYAYFVETGMISVVSVMDDGSTIEVGTIGKEGVVGADLLLGTKSLPYQYFVQLPGRGYRVVAEVLKDFAKLDEEFRDLVLRCQAAFQTQTMQTAACNGLHSVTQRCCRWLLMSQDCLDGNAIPLTHEFLGLMLGVRRASVTDVLKPLQERGWIQLNRSEIMIVDRTGLETGSCECYRVITEHQQQLLN